MLIHILKSKIQSLKVTESSIEYPGSISLPEGIMKAANIRQFEQVHVNNRSNGNRIVTYAISNNQNGKVTVNGAASRLFNPGDIIHVITFAMMEETEADTYIPMLVKLNSENALIEAMPYRPVI